MSIIDDLQRDINHLAYTTFKKNCPKYPKEELEKFSIPLIPRITQTYLEYRLVILGQETYTWYGKTWYKENGEKNPLYKEFNLFDFINAQEADVERVCQVCRYDEFTLYGGAQRRRGFWTLNRKICKDVLKDPINYYKGLPFCWLELFCTEKVEFEGKKKGQPSQNETLAKVVVDMQGDLLYQILKLIEPKVILAATNHKNDKFLKPCALGDPNAQIVAIDNSGSFSADDIAFIDVTQGGLKGVKVIRTKHPNCWMTGERRESYNNLIFEFLRVNL